MLRVPIVSLLKFGVKRDFSKVLNKARCNMKRYHIKVYIPILDKQKLKSLTDKLNGLTWEYSKHSLDGLKFRITDVKSLLFFIKGVTLDPDAIFEYYAGDNGDITKICYRIQYTAGTDIILILSNTKKIITIYLNASSDEHFTLDKSLYIRN